MLRLESEDLCVDMSGFKSMDAMFGVIDAQKLTRCDDCGHEPRWCSET